MRTEREQIKIRPELTLKFLQAAVAERLKTEGKSKCIIHLESMAAVLVMFLAKSAVGCENVNVITFKSEQAADKPFNLIQIARDNGFTVESIDISDEAERIMNRLSDLSMDSTDVVDGIRSAILCGMSAASDALILGSWTKTALLQGRLSRLNTLFVPFLPIGDLYDTQMGQLLEYSGLQNPFSASASESESLDFFYYLYVDCQLSFGEAAAAVGGETMLDVVMPTRVSIEKALSQFTTPIIPKLSNHTLGLDLLWPKGGYRCSC